MGRYGSFQGRIERLQSRYSGVHRLLQKIKRRLKLNLVILQKK